MRTPHLISFTATDTPDATSTNDAGRMIILGDDGHVHNGFLDIDLEALGNNTTNGLLTRTGSGTVAARTITGPAAGISISNGDGVSGNPTLALANDLAAYEGLSATGLVARTGDGTAAARTLTSATTDSLTISDAGGVAGNPTFRIDSTLDALAAANWVANAIPIGSGADTLSQVAFAANTFPARASTGDLVAKTISDDALAFVAAANDGAMRTELGLGTMATQNANAVAITGGTVAGLSSLGVVGDVALSGGGTSQRFQTWANTGGTLYIGKESNTAGGFFLGSSAYANVYYDVGGNPHQFMVAGAGKVADISSTGLAVTGLSITQGAVISGTYTPTLTGVANVDSTTARVSQYMRVGNVVTVSGSMAVNATATTTTTVGVSLPVASNLANAFECSGTTGSSTAGSGFVAGDATNNRAQVSYLAGGFTSDEEIYFHFTYLVI